MQRSFPNTKLSEVVPTEYDVEQTKRGRVVLVDDRRRRFVALTLRAAFRKAERAQNPHDPIHHPPFPSPEEVPAP